MSLLRYMGIVKLSTAELAETYANDDSRFFQYRGDNIHYRVEGLTDDNAPVIVMLHGIMSSLHTWDDWVEHLRHDYKIIRIDVPSFGLSGAISDGDSSIESLVDRVNALMVHLELESFVLAGNSLGGYISWSYTVAHPEKVRALVLLDAAGYPMSLPPIMKLFTTPYLRHAVRLMTPRFAVQFILSEVYGDSKRITPNKIPYYQDMMLHRGNPLALLRVFEELDNMTHDHVKEIKTPTLIQWGEKDKWIPPHNAQLFQNDIAGSEVIMYPGVGHVPMEEIPEQTARDVHEFLQRVLAE